MSSMKNDQSLDDKSDLRSGSCYTLDNEDASWITRFSVDEEFKKKSEYAFDCGLNVMKSLSQLSVRTAEQIDYGYQEYIDDDKECDFKPQDCFSECSCGRQSSHPPKKHLAPGNPYTSSGDFSTRPSYTGLTETVLQQTRNHKELPLYYQLLELNRDPIDMPLRLINVPSQYQVYEMHEFFAIYCSPGIEKLNGFDWTKKEKQMEKDSEYCIEF